MTEQRIDLGLTASTPTASTPSGGGCGDGCGCGAGGAASTPSTTPATTELLVEGMTCGHCVRAVTDELNALEGVDVVDIDLRVGAASVVRIASSGSASDDDLAAAVDEAGYTLAH